MKQIYIGPKQRSELMAIRRRCIRFLHWSQMSIIALLILIPTLFKSSIFKLSGEYSAVACVETYSGTGSAVFVGANMLLTAAHVVDGMGLNEYCSIRFESPDDMDALPVLAKAELVAKGNWSNVDQDPEQDYALLHISSLDASKIVQPCSIGNASTIQTQQEIFIQGYPGGNYVTSQGIVGALTLQGQYKSIFTVTAKAWQGNSGGAMFDDKGNLLGIVIMGGVKTGYNDGQTYVLKIDPIMNQLRAKGFQF